MDYAVFNNMFDINGLKADINNVGGSKREEVPHGLYEVEITKLELGASKKQLPMLKVWFKITAGKYKGSMLFMNQLLTSGFGIHTANVFLKSLCTGDNIEFVDFTQYGQLIDNLFDKVNGARAFALNYGENKGFNTFNITEVYSV